MNSGGEPERDDTGLPPVDIEIPDDARELDRDVQAYYREQRAERRRQRHDRLHSRFARDGIVLPVLACCLILALIAGTLLTVFTATSDQNLIRPTDTSTGANRQPGSATPSAPVLSTPASSAPAERAPGPAVTQGKPLPAGTLRLADSGRTIRLQSLGQAMLVLVPHRCRCSAAVSWVAGIASSHGVTAYLVGTPKTIAEAQQFHSRLGARLQAALPVALDSRGVLAQNYPVNGLTAVLVAGSGLQAASYAENLQATDSTAPLVHALTG